MRTKLGDELAKAKQFVEDAQRLVWEQNGLILRLRKAGRGTLSAEKTLKVLETNLQTFREYQTALEQKRDFAETSRKLALPPRLLAAE